MKLVMERKICNLFNSGFNTHQIAVELDLAECQVVRVLERKHLI